MALFVPDVFVLHPAFAAFDIRDLHNGFRLPLSTTTSDRLLIACNKVIKANFSLCLEACDLIDCVLKANRPSTPASPTPIVFNDQLAESPSLDFAEDPEDCNYIAFISRPPSPAPSDSSCAAVVDFPMGYEDKALPPLPAAPLTPPTTPPRSPESLSDTEALSLFVSAKPAVDRPLPALPSILKNPKNDLPMPARSCCTPEWVTCPASRASPSDDDAYDGVSWDSDENSDEDADSDCDRDSDGDCDPEHLDGQPAENIAQLYSEVRGLRANHREQANEVMLRIRHLHCIERAIVMADVLRDRMEAGARANRV